MRRFFAGATAAMLGISLVPMAAHAATTDPDRPTVAAAVEPGRLKTTSLARLLAADDTQFDTDAKDFDIFEASVKAVLKAKPKSQLRVLKDGDVALTAFIPDDQAFQRLLSTLTRKTSATDEAAAFKALTTRLEIGKLESVLLYHIVPGRTMDLDAVKAADKTRLTTATGRPVTIQVSNGRYVLMVDQNPKMADAYVMTTNLNAGNRQMAHSLSQVMRTVDL